ncbi:MAG TPA: outer membrane beta-barrel protein [Terriglobales bacterium]|nr:outer membrane beta-barrel protein [Terriglobales bacterium]
MDPFKRLLFFLLVISLCLPALAQQTDINRYTLFTGFDYLISPARGLTERGFEGDFGVTLKPWLGAGADFSAMGNGIISGAGGINGSETVYAPLIAPYVDPSAVTVPFKSTTYVFAAGPQFYIRKWDKVTFLVRPGFGGIHEAADISLSPQLIGLFQLLGIPVPNSHQTDTTWFIGVGGGFDINFSKHVALRYTTDWVNTHLFSDLLVPRQNYWRFAVGPTFRWGHLQQK